MVPMPVSFGEDANRIAQYTADYADIDLTVAAQVALWMAQGHRPDEIFDKFPFNDDDLKIALDMIK